MQSTGGFTLTTKHHETFPRRTTDITRHDASVQAAGHNELASLVTGEALSLSVHNHVFWLGRLQHARPLWPWTGLEEEIEPLAGVTNGPLCAKCMKSPGVPQMARCSSAIVKPFAD